MASSKWTRHAFTLTSILLYLRSTMELMLFFQIEVRGYEVLRYCSGEVIYIS